ncbi:MAG: ATP-grasp domain-containing protein [candidate division SR1 bacterium]|nr:ATP-grasp domain-containing protein [candidate division SR1 bacterium]
MPIKGYSYRLDIWKSICDKRNFKYTTNTNIPSYLIIHLSKDYTFYGRKDSFNSPISSTLTKHKSLTYSLLKNSDIPIPKNIIITKDELNKDLGDKIKANHLDFPLVIKPSNTDNSVHVYIVKDLVGLIDKIHTVFQDKNYDILEIIIQEYINIQKEYRVLFFNKNISHNLSNDPIILLAYNKLRLNQRKNSENYNIANEENAHYEIVASNTFLKKFKVIVDRVVECIPGLGWAGIDIVEDINGKLWFLEVNSDPGFKLLRKLHGDKKIEEIYNKMMDYMIG